MSYTPTTWHKGDKVTAEKLNKIEQGIVDAEQSGSSLPDYSQANDDDVLAIENGAPAWKEPSGGGGDIYAVTVDTSDMMTYSNPSKTVDEISAAFNEGKLPILRCRVVQGETIAFLPIVFYFVGGMADAVVFTDVGGGNGDLTILADGTVEHTTSG